MATKKISTTESLTDTFNADSEVDVKPKAPLTQANETAKALAALIHSRPAPAPDEVFQPAANANFETPATASPESPPAAIAKILDGPVESLVAQVFESSPDREFTVNAVLSELRQTEPDINENSIRFTITELKRKSVIHHVRNQGHYQILKFTKPGEEKRFPQGSLLDKLATKSALKGSPADGASDLAVLKEASAVIAKLQALVQRNQDILTQIAKLRSVL